MHSQSLPTSHNSGALDLYAAGIAILCLLHCLALPLLVSSVSLAIPFAGDETIHKLLVLIAAPATITILLAKHARHSGRGFVALAVIGLALLFAGAFVPVDALFERVTTVSGAIMLATAHVWRAARLRTAAPATPATTSKTP